MPADIGAFKKIADKHNLKLIEDTAFDCSIILPLYIPMKEENINLVIKEFKANVVATPVAL